MSFLREAIGDAAPIWFVSAKDLAADPSRPARAGGSFRGGLPASSQSPGAARSCRIAAGGVSAVLFAHRRRPRRAVKDLFLPGKLAATLPPGVLPLRQRAA